MPGTALTIDEREAISRGLVDDDTFTDIAVRIDRDKSTVSREVGRNGGRHDYRARSAQEVAEKALAQPKARELAVNDRLHEQVERRLEKLHSPEQISDRLVEDFPDDQDMRISHETIYTELYLQGRGSLREELTEALRTGRAKRRPKAQPRQRLPRHPQRRR